MSSLPDVAVHAHPHPGAVLDWVGMNGIEMPVHLDAGNGDVQRASARVGLFVDLAQPEQRALLIETSITISQRQARGDHFSPGAISVPWSPAMALDISARGDAFFHA